MSPVVSLMSTTFASDPLNRMTATPQSATAAAANCIPRSRSPRSRTESTAISTGASA
jgi:hypothetical protein